MQIQLVNIETNLVLLHRIERINRASEWWWERDTERERERERERITIDRFDMAKDGNEKQTQKCH